MEGYGLERVKKMWKLRGRLRRRYAGGEKRQSQWWRGEKGAVWSGWTGDARGLEDMEYQTSRMVRQMAVQGVGTAISVLALMINR